MPDVVLNAKFDLNGNRTVLNAQVDVGSGLNDDFQDSMAFDRLNRETSIIQQAKSGGYAVGYKKTTLSWNNDSRLTALADYKDSSTEAASGTFTYDRAGRLTGLDWFGPDIGYGGDGEYLEQLSWGYDNDSRVTSLTNAAHTSEALTYNYDHDWQLTSAAGYGGYGGYGGGSWAWDANGDPSGTGRIVGAGNRLLSDGTYNFEYDKSGHMVKKTAISGGAYTIYDWNNRGNLFKATDYTSGGTVTQTVELWYDPFNDLIGRTRFCLKLRQRMQYNYVHLSGKCRSLQIDWLKSSDVAAGLVRTAFGLSLSRGEGMSGASRAANFGSGIRAVGIAPRL